MCTFERIQAGSTVVISFDNAGRATIAPEAERLSDRGTDGAIRLEVPATCLAVVREECSELPRRRLQRIREIQEFQRIVRSNAGAVVIATLDDKGRLCLSRKGFQSLGEATDRLQGRQGTWVIVRLDQLARLLPSPDHFDPFSKALPIENSLTVANGNSLCGLLRKPRGLFQDMVVEWVFWHCTPGFPVKLILERIRRVDHGIQDVGHPSVLGDLPSDQRGLVFEKMRSGETRLVHFAREPEEASAFVEDRAGLFLVTRRLDHVDTH